VTAARRVAQALADQFDGFDPVLLARRPPFVAAVTAALDVIDEGGIVALVVESGSLAGSRSPYGVVISRVRDVPRICAERRQLADDRAEAGRWQAIDRAARRGETLRVLVAQHAIFPDEASEMVAAEFDDPDLAAIAIAALGGGVQ